jgi:hypothetical protein
MRRKRSPRTPLQRVALILAALSTLLLGYYLGNLYRLDELKQHGAVPLDQALPLDTADLPDSLRQSLNDTQQWVIFLAGEPGQACDRLFDQYVEVYNRLAAYPKIQSRLHLALLTTASDEHHPWPVYDWAKVYRLTPAQRDKLTSAAGIAPIGNRWCQDVQATAALAGPGASVRALLPLDKPAEMAESLRLIITTYRSDA